MSRQGCSLASDALTAGHQCSEIWMHLFAIVHHRTTRCSEHGGMSVDEFLDFRLFGRREIVMRSS